MNMRLETERLILRPWKIEDAPSLFKYAQDERIGPAAGWPPHRSPEESEKIIRDVLSSEGTFAVALKETGEPVGSIGISVTEDSGRDHGINEYEAGYWVGVPYWGLGLIPEALQKIQEYIFTELDGEALRAGYFDGNIKSLKVLKKCGHRYHHTVYDRDIPTLNEKKTEHYMRITRDKYLKLNKKDS